MSTILLEIVQDILSDMESDMVNSVSDTIESEQVATIVKNVHDDIVTNYDLTNVKTLFQLQSLSDTLKPTIMKIPDGYHQIEWIRYNTKKISTDQDFWNVIHWLCPEDFTRHALTLNSTDSNVMLQSIVNNIELPIKKDASPTYWTSFDDVYVVFDSFDLSVNSTLIEDKTNCYGQGRPLLVVADGTVINLPARFISLLRNEARAMAFDMLRGGITPKVEQASFRSRVRVDRVRDSRRRKDEIDDLPNYGRQRRR